MIRRYGATGGAIVAIRRRSGRYPLYGLIFAQIDATRNGRTIQKLLTISAPRTSSWRMVRARSGGRSACILSASIRSAEEVERLLLVRGGHRQDALAELAHAAGRVTPSWLSRLYLGLRLAQRRSEPLAIHKFIGRRPIFAFGNSDGTCRCCSERRQKVRA